MASSTVLYHLTTEKLKKSKSWKWLKFKMAAILTYMHQNSRFCYKCSAFNVYWYVLVSFTQEKLKKIKKWKMTKIQNGRCMFIFKMAAILAYMHQNGQYFRLLKRDKRAADNFSAKNSCKLYPPRQCSLLQTLPLQAMFANLQTLPPKGNMAKFANSDLSMQHLCQGSHAHSAKFPMFL